MRLLRNPTLRLATGLLSLALTLLLALDLIFGVFPDPARHEARQRARQAESIAIQVAATLMSGQVHTLNTLLPELVARDAQLQDIGVRRADGQLLSATDTHATRWHLAGEAALGRSRFVIPLQSGGQTPWGQVELAYQPLDESLFAYLSPALRLLLLFSLIGGLLYYAYLRRALLHLDPSAAVPERVQLAFDAMSEAVVVLDAAQRIVMHNRAFAHLVPDDRERILGNPLEAFAWLQMGAEHLDARAPWHECFDSRERAASVGYEIRLDGERQRRLIANASPILDAANDVRGCMVSFTDVTELDEANRQLVALAADLSSSKELLAIQNLELKRLASIDPMTGARNRRAFFPEFERQFAEARARSLPLAFIMADIDHFKAVNDNHGHAIGDKVIQRFANILLAAARDSDIVCRYGGEEFCIALPGADLEQAWQVAERIRARVQAELGPSLGLDPAPQITASFGVAALNPAASNADALADQADQALYHSKRHGRNRSTRWSALFAATDQTD